MPNQDKPLKGKEASREALSQVLGLNLSDDTVDSLVNGEDLSFELLSKHHTLTEIGTALIRLDALCIERTEANPCQCYITLPNGKQCCYPCPEVPPE